MERVCTLPAVFRSNVVIVIRVSHDGEAATLRGRGEGPVVSFVSSFRGLRGESRVSSIELKVAGILLQRRVGGGGTAEQEEQEKQARKEQSRLWGYVGLYPRAVSDGGGEWK
jgi:hypothetical protein